MTGVDVAPSSLSKARDLVTDLPNITFQETDARSLSFEDKTFDVVVFGSTLSYVPGPVLALAEAFRVLRPRGWLAVFDGDYATTTVALGNHDPLQAWVDTLMSNSVHNRQLMRRLPVLIRDCGFENVRFRSHGFVERSEAVYILTIVERGAGTLPASGQISDDMATLKAEARRRVEAEALLELITYASLATHRR